MPYKARWTDAQKKQRALHVEEKIWKKFKAACHSHAMPIQAVLNELILAVVNGEIELVKPQHVALRFEKPKRQRKIDIGEKKEWR